MSKTLKRVLIILLCLVLAVVLMAGGYVLYIVLQYSRIPDFTPLEIENPQQAVLQTEQPYTALTYNIGFGAYNPDFSFFMDTGVMKDGAPVAGSHARAQSAEIVQANTQGAIALLGQQNPDFCLLQEVDEKSDRSWKTNQAALISSWAQGYSSVYASNFHSAYLAYPFHEPHGAVESGLLTLSRYAQTGAVRRSYPVDTGFPTKFFDLDRCFVVHRIPVEGGAELVLINTHMSAYDEGGLIRAQQMEMLTGVLRDERAKGNWVVVGGDFNHNLTGIDEAFPTQQQVPEWVAMFDTASLPEGFRVVGAENAASVSTCRSSDLPYTKGVNYETVLDGFIVSDNVAATATNIDTGYLHSDHNPVLLRFSLTPAAQPEEAPAA